MGCSGFIVCGYQFGKWGYIWSFQRIAFRNSKLFEIKTRVFSHVQFLLFCYIASFPKLSCHTRKLNDVYRWQGIVQLLKQNLAYYWNSDIANDRSWSFIWPPQAIDSMLLTQHQISTCLHIALKNLSMDRKFILVYLYTMMNNWPSVDRNDPYVLLRIGFGK